MPLVQMLNPKVRHMVYEKSLLALDVLGNISALAIHNIKLYRQTRELVSDISPILEFSVGDKVLVRNHMRHVWDPKYDVVYCVVCDGMTIGIGG